MASLLFQSAGKGGSSSSSSSASANPFQALAHFYEQELSDLQTDSRLNSNSLDNSSRQYRQQHSFGKQSAASRGHNRLFPSSASPSSSPSLYSSPSSTSTLFATGGRYTQKDHTSYTQLQDEFKIFGTPSASEAPSHVPNQHHQNHHHHHGGANADISEYLKQRQEYYAREALIRGQDHRDGLGPIVDFSEQVWADVDRAGKYPSKSRLEDHLEARHNNPYAAASSLGQKIQQEHYQLNQKSHHQWGEQQQQRMQASSQQEQVFLDFGRSDGSEVELMNGMDRVWNMTHATSNSSASASATGSSAYRDAAMSIHSVWPLAPWAIETETALMEFEAAHHDDGGQYHCPGHGAASPLSGSDWSEEYTPAAVAPSLSSRRESLKTCGFMFDTKHDGQDLSDPATILSLAEDTHLHSQGASLPPRHQPPVSDTVAMSMHQPIQEPIERMGQAYNDDVFEGEMLQAWMETLAQEKQEADEHAKEEDKKAKEVEKEVEEKTLDETEQKLVLEVALRRLNALMRQLDHKQGGAVVQMAPKAAQAITSRSV